MIAPAHSSVPTERRATAPSNTPVRGSRAYGRALRLFTYLLFTTYVLTFLNMWIWGDVRSEDPLGVGARTPLIQYSVWLFTPLLAFLVAQRTSLAEILRPLAPYAPFVAFGLLSGVASLGRADFVRPMTFFVVGALGIVLFVRVLGLESLKTALFWTLLSSLVVSIVLCVFFPAENVRADLRTASGAVWVGVFWQKNSLGIQAAWALVMLLFWGDMGRKRLLLLAAVGLVCLQGADSAGSLVAVVGAFLSVTLVAFIRTRRWTRGLKTLSFALGVLAAIVCAANLAPVLLGLIGRDTNLTGRADIWPVFFERAMQRPLLGWGPGTFTFPSYATSDLVAHFEYIGNISSPHNMYIAALGDGGIVCLLGYALPLFHLAFVVPFREPGSLGLHSAAVGTMVILHGFSESSLVFGFNLNWLMTILMFVALDDQRRQRQDGARREVSRATRRAGGSGG